LLQMWRVARRDFQREYAVRRLVPHSGKEKDYRSCRADGEECAHVAGAKGAGRRWRHDPTAAGVAATVATQVSGGAERREYTVRRLVPHAVDKKDDNNTAAPTGRSELSAAGNRASPPPPPQVLLLVGGGGGGCLLLLIGLGMVG
jgi:hypothetical protein